MAEAVRVNPAVLVWARETAGLDREDAAKRVPMDPLSLAALETGDADPNVTRLRRLAELYHRPVAVLLLPTPPTEEPLPRDFRTVGGGAPRLGPEVRLALRRARRIQRFLAGLARDESGYWAPNTVARRTLANDPAAVGAEIRLQLGVSDAIQRSWRDPWAALRAWRAAVERTGVLTIADRWPRSECQGIAFWDEYVPAIVITTNEQPVARCFTLLHEFAHLTLRQGGSCLEREDDSHNGRVERWCNQVAAAALVPERMLRDEVGRRPDAAPGLDFVEQLVPTFNVSRHVIALRLEELGIAPRGFYLKLLAQLQSVSSAETEESGGFGQSSPRRTLAFAGKAPVQALVKAVADDVLTRREAADLLNARGDHWEELAELAAKA